jgi:hypothetical protein
MSFQNLDLTKVYHKYAEKTKGEVIVEGFFIGSTQGTYGIQHNFRTLDGKLHVLNSAGHLNYAVEQLTVGNFCQIRYDGEIRLTKGPMAGKNAHQFLVAVDPDRKMGVDPTPVPIEEPKPDNDDPLF